MSQVYFICIAEGSRLRIRITSEGYNPEANCQFPRNIRQNGAKYSAPSSAITFGQGPAGKFFYRVKPKMIQIISEGIVTGIPTSMILRCDNIYEEINLECVVCMDMDHDVVIVPCGHYCLCHVCATTIRRTSGVCPMCRGRISNIVTKDQIQT